MIEERHGNGGDEVTDAMNRVLQAERDATRSLDSTTRQAAKILAEARVDRDRILARAERRITELRKMVARQLADEIRRLQTTATGATRELERDRDEERLRFAVARVALRLTGGADEG